jgi:hypothetical protein
MFLKIGPKDFKKLQKTSKNFKGNIKCFLQNFKDFFVAFSKLQIVDWRLLQCIGSPKHADSFTGRRAGSLSCQPSLTAQAPGFEN